ncbi:MAG: ABC transporter ATP-binding protein [Pseudomonadota bacterium]
MAQSPEKPITLWSAYKRFLWVWIWPHRGKFITAVVLAMVVAIATGAFAKVTQQIVIALTEPEQAAFPLAWAPAVIILLAVVRSFATYAKQILINAAITGAAQQMQIDLYKKFLWADMATLQDEASASSAARFNNDVNIATGSAQVVFRGYSMMTIILSTLAFMVSINWQLTLAFVAVLSLAVGPILQIGKRMRRLSSRNQAQVGVVTAGVAEGLTSIRLIRTYGLEDRALDDASEDFAKLRKLKLKQVDATARIIPITELLGGVAVAALLTVIVIFLNEDENIIADFVGLLAGMGLIAPQSQRLGKIYTKMQQGVAAMARVYAVLDEEAEIVSKPGAEPLVATRGEVVFDGVSFAYPDGTLALDSVSFTVSTGQTVAFVGRSGAGKSTVFNLIPRLYDATQGRVLIDGQDVRDVTIESLREGLSLVSQDSVLLSGTLADNIRFGRPGADDAQVIAAAQAASADAFITAQPEGYATKITPEAHGLSGGQRQRMSIARAMLRDAPILLLDEPTSALDAEAEAAVRASLDRLTEGKTTLVIAHRLATILSADQIMVMDAGKIVERGTHTELLALGGIYAGLFKLQFEDAQASAL